MSYVYDTKLMIELMSFDEQEAFKLTLLLVDLHPRQLFLGKTARAHMYETLGATAVRLVNPLRLGGGA